MLLLRFDFVPARDDQRHVLPNNEDQTMGYLSELRPFGRRGWPDAEDLFGRFFAPAAPRASRKEEWMPRVDIVEKTEAYLITAEVPGIDPKEIDVTLSGDTLTIRGERTMEEKSEGDHQHASERIFGAFERTFSFPAPVSADGVEAETKNGVITIRVPKSREAQPRKIQIKSK